jgi:hypothetical protein
MDRRPAVDRGVPRAPVSQSALDPRGREHLDLLGDQLDVALHLSPEHDDGSGRVELARDLPGHADLAADQPSVSVDDRVRGEDHRAAADVQIAADTPVDRDRAARASHVAVHGAAESDGARGDDEVALHASARDDAAPGGDEIALDVGLDLHPGAEGVEVAGDGGPALDHCLADLRVGGARASRGHEERSDDRQRHAEARE